ncbi:TetR family transcriptional regulator [Streptomyces orinoci]|uniref:TetR family transcriptional regulator n=1 Tax=Streptomyces orinoci TaxID=67339 RepID=A0ABV3JQ06_STRON|nr:TetR family transcriptional regulator [Streptomyces orinoci]
MAIDNATDPAAPPGLRERKKQRTRNTLIRCALELFTAKGYEATTVDEIAAAADVSQRTFFRYFANKEEVALSLQAVEEEYALAALLARPAAEGPLTAVRNGATASWGPIRRAIAEVVPVTLHLRMQRVIESTPQLLAARLRRLGALEERLAAELARREGLDPALDPRPRVLVAACCGVMRAAARVWSEDENAGLDDLVELMTRHLDQLAPALADDWRTGR